MSGVNLFCKLDSEQVPAKFLHDDVVECHTPPHVEGFVHLEFTLNGELTSNPSKTPWKESYMYVASGSVKNIFSFYGYGGSVIEVRGEDFKPGYACRIGANPVPTHFVSSTLLRCEVPGHVEESVTVDVSNAAGTFGTFSDIEFQYTPKAVISQVSPRMGNSQGGTVLSVNGRNFASTNMLKCRVGTIEMNGVWKSSTDVECVTPAAQPGPVNSTIGRLVQISTNQKDFTTGEMKFMHQPLSGVDAAFPSSLPAAGGAPVAVHLPLAHPSEDPKCRFGITVMPGVLEAHLGTVACVSPYSQPGFVAVHVARNGADFEYLPPGVVDGNGVIVEMKVAMEVIVVFPEVGFKGGGGVVEVTGDHILYDDVQCVFGTDSTTAHVVSSAFIYCEVPAHDVGVVTLELASAASGATEPLVRPNFLFDEIPVVSSIKPASGFLHGGNTVTTRGTHFSEIHDIACRFGSIGPVDGEWIADDELRCNAPAHAAAFVPFNVGLRDDYALRGGAKTDVMYEYAVTPTLTTVVENDDRTVTVLGTGFVTGEKVYCDLGSGNGYVEGTVQDEHTILCATGLGGAAVVAGNITVNDEDGNSVLTPLSTDASEVSTIALAPTSIDKVTPTGPR